MIKYVKYLIAFMYFILFYEPTSLLLTFTTFVKDVKGLLHLPKIYFYIKNKQANPAQMRESNAKVTQCVTF